MKQRNALKGGHKTPRVFQLECWQMTSNPKRAFNANGPQEAFEALALPTYPLTPMGFASLPGRVAQ
jgi:hypothetical protein